MTLPFQGGITQKNVKLKKSEKDCWVCLRWAQTGIVENVCIKRGETDSD
jgi:hypothetical protein